jgi:hypothetical protein
VLARTARQQPFRPQFVRIAVILGLVARQRHQPGLGLWRDRRLPARSRPVIESRQRTIGQCPLDTALNRLVIALPHKTMGSLDKPEAFAPAPPGSQAPCANAIRLSAPRSHRSDIANSTTCRHPAMMQLLVRSITNKESIKILPVPRLGIYRMHPDSRNRSSSV